MITDYKIGVTGGGLTVDSRMFSALRLNAKDAIFGQGKKGCAVDHRLLADAVRSEPVLSPCSILKKRYSLGQRYGIEQASEEWCAVSPHYHLAQY